MRIAINTKPLQTNYRIQGIGVYVRHLLQTLNRYDKENEYIEFSSTTNLPKNVDLVHYSYFNPFFLTLPLVKMYPTIVTVHDLIPLVFPQHFPAGIKGQLKWQIQKISLRGASAIIADSNSSKHDIVKYTGIPDKKIHVVYLAAGKEFREMENGKDRASRGKMEITKKYKLPPKFVLYVGDVLWTKNVPNLIRAIKTINVTLVMVGKQAASTDFNKSNPWNKDLVLLNELARDDKRVMRLGFVPEDDLVAIYNVATLFVLPSFYEGFGLPILEAMSCGCPVITTRGGSLPEVAGEAAYYVDPDDVSSIANGIGEVFFNRTLQNELSKKGLIQAKKFSWKRTAEETVKVYEKVMGSK